MCIRDSVKGDVDGSVEALSDSLIKLSTEQIQVNVIHKGVEMCIRDRAEAEDVVQDTMIRVWNKRDEWSQFESVEAYCLIAVSYTHLDVYKRQLFVMV